MPLVAMFSSAFLAEMGASMALAEEATVFCLTEDLRGPLSS